MNRYSQTAHSLMLWLRHDDPRTGSGQVELFTELATEFVYTRLWVVTIHYTRLCDSHLRRRQKVTPLLHELSFSQATLATWHWPTRVERKQLHNSNSRFYELFSKSPSVLIQRMSPLEQSSFSAVNCSWRYAFHYWTTGTCSSACPSLHMTSMSARCLNS